MGTPAVVGHASTGTLPPLLEAYLVKTALEAGKPDLYYGRFAQPFTLPLHAGLTIEWFRYENAEQRTSSVTEGVTPQPVGINRTKLTATVKEYIWWHGFNDVIDLSDTDQRVLTNLSEKLGQCGAESLDTVDGINITSGTSVVFAGGVAARGNVAALPSPSDFEKIKKILDQNHAKMVRKQIDAQAKDGTAPIRPGFVVIAHTDARPHYEAFPGWRDASEYPTKDALDGEGGAWKNFRFFFTANGVVKRSAGAAVGSDGFESQDSTNNDVYCTVVIAQDGFGSVPYGGMSGKSMKTIFNNLGSSGSADPGAQRGSIAKKTWHESKILNEDFILRYEHCVSVNP